MDPYRYVLALRPDPSVGAPVSGPWTWFYGDERPRHSLERARFEAGLRTGMPPLELALRKELASISFEDFARSPLVRDQARRIRARLYELQQRARRRSE